jgi:hypothetical protein
MKPNKIKKLFMGLLLVALFLTGISSTTVNAQEKKGHKNSRVVIYQTYNPYWHTYYYDPFWDPSYYGTYRVVNPVAYEREQGYSEGKHEGKKDAKKDRQPNPTGHKDYLKSDSMTFRNAFVQGYNDGYQEEIADMR